MATDGARIAAGGGLRVGVIDSGVNEAHPHIGRIAGGITITGESQEEGFVDRIGHGTAVLAAIQEKAPDAEYFAVRVFDSRLQTNIETLVRAIGWCVDHKMDIINLSLGTANPAHAERFAPWIGSAIFVSARLTGTEPAYPGSLEGTIGVEAAADLPRDRYSIHAEAGRTVFLASPYPRPIPGVPLERNLSGASFAVANMCGFVIRACTGIGKPGSEAARTRLIAAAQFNTFF